MADTAQEVNAVADRFFAAIENQDIETLAGLYSSDARIWKNYNEIEITAEASLAFLKGVGEYLSDVHYEKVRRRAYDGGFVQQHYFSGTVRETGQKLSIPVCVMAQVEGGKVKRIDEYLDSAHRLPVRV